MGHIRKVDNRTWIDSKFRSLSREAKLTWLYLLTGPETTSIPGVIVAGPAHMAEVLETTPERFGEWFGELYRVGLVQVDWTARLVWLPKATRYNRPSNPNTVASWRHFWDLVPECELKSVIWQHLKGFTESLGESFAKRFREHCRNGFEVVSPSSASASASACIIPPLPPTGGEATKPTRTKRQSEELPPIPPTLDTPAFRAAWSDWLAYRRERRASCLPRCLRLQLDYLAGLGEAGAVEAIRRSIRNGWAGLFEERGNGKLGGTTTKHDQGAALLDAVARDRGEEVDL